MYMYRRVCWDEFSSTHLLPLLNLKDYTYFLQLSSRQETRREYLIELLCSACMVTISSYTTQKLESVTQLAYMFVTIPAINTRSDS